MLVGKAARKKKGYEQGNRATYTPYKYSSKALKQEQEHVRPNRHPFQQNNKPRKQKKRTALTLTLHYCMILLTGANGAAGQL